jgi:hypothetical protein
VIAKEERGRERKKIIKIFFGYHQLFLGIQNLF